MIPKRGGTAVQLRKSLTGGILKRPIIHTVGGPVWSAPRPFGKGLGTRGSYLRKKVGMECGCKEAQDAEKKSYRDRKKTGSGLAGEIV